MAQFYYEEQKYKLYKKKIKLKIEKKYRIYFLLVQQFFFRNYVGETHGLIEVDALGVESKLRLRLASNRLKSERKWRLK